MSDLVQYGTSLQNRWNDFRAAPPPYWSAFQQASPEQMALMRQLLSAVYQPPPHWQIRIPDDIQ